MRKICVVITARASYSRFKSALKAMQAHPDLNLQLVLAASTLLDRYGNAARYIEEEGFSIAARVQMVLEGENLTTMAKTTGLGLIEFATVFENLKPDAVVTIADRYETMATAIAASYMNIPLVHIQGGEITGSIDEKVRHAITKLANLHLVSSEHAKNRVIRMGEDPETVFVTGCPSVDLAAEVLLDPALNFNPFEKYGGVGETLDLSAGYIVVLQHPVTTQYEEAKSHIEETLYAVRDLRIPALWFWPNVDAGSDGTSKGIRSFREKENPSNMHFFRNFRSSDFLRLLYNSRGLVGNSSVAIRECSFLGIPAVNIGNRQQGRDRGKNILDVPYDRKAIRQTLETVLKNGRSQCDLLYGDGQAGKRIADTLAIQPLRIEKRLRYS